MSAAVGAARGRELAVAGLRAIRRAGLRAIPPEVVARGAAAGRPGLASAAVVAVAFVPLLVAFVWRLLGGPGAAFALVAVVEAAALAVIGWSGGEWADRGRRGPALALARAAWAFLAVAAWANSPWLAAVAGLTALAACACELGGRELTDRLAPAWFALALAVPLPAGLGGWLEGHFQDTATRGASAVIDLLGVDHVLTGNVVELGGGGLVLGWSFRGLGSPHALMLAALGLAAWFGRGAAGTAVLMASALGWALLGNVARMTAVVWLAAFGFDAESGWGHGALTLGACAGAVALTASTEHLMRFAEDVHRTRRSRRAVAFSSSYSGSYDFLAHRGAGVSSGLPAAPRRRPPERALWPTSRRAGLAFGVIVLVQPAAWAWRAPGVAVGAAGAPQSFRDLTESSLPTGFGPYERREFRRARGERGGPALVWTYGGDRPLTLTVEGTPLGPQAPAGAGWEPVERRAGPGFEAETLARPGGRRALRLGGTFDAAGRPTALPRGGLLRAAWARLGRGAPPPAGAGPAYRVRVFVEGGHALSEADRKGAEGLFEEARAKARRDVSP